jgi:hypothetical protein
LALLADAVMSAMPWASNSITDLPALLTVWDCGHIANYLMAGDDWEAVPKGSVLDAGVGVTDTAGENFDQYFTGGWLLELEVFKGKGSIFLLYDGSFIGLWKRSHVGDDGVGSGFENYRNLDREFIGSRSRSRGRK